MSELRSYNFTRSARKSILLSLGVSPVADPSSGTAQDTLRPYSKASDDACVNAYMSCLLGAGTFRLSSAIHRCGMFIGVGALLAMSLFHIFMCLRLVEVPQLIEQDVANTTSLAKVFFSRKGAVLFAVMSIIGWFGACAVQLQSVANDVLRAFAGSAPSLELEVKLICAAGLAVVMVPMSLKTSAKDLQTGASYALYSMLLVGAVEMTCAFTHGMYRWRDCTEGTETCPTYALFGSNICLGIFDMGLAFGGVAILPYVLADMLNPQNARKVVLKASSRVMVFYLAVSVTCYFGWAETIEYTSPIEMMMQMQGQGYHHAARVISFLFVVKTVFTLPIIFWPLCREVDAFLDLDEDPSLQLQLPWAIRRQQHFKVMLRMFLVMLTLSTTLLDQVWKNDVVSFVIMMSLAVGQFMFPGCVAALAIRWHEKKLLEGRERSGPRVAEGQREVRYLFSSFRTHYVIVHFTAVFTLIAGLIALCWMMYSLVEKSRE
eukprot:TRINITY_DN97751_c0_g1_i1.p1 TRINITY_DN97751_c0_g1~~TRINITY_DN97751_c0_g1_i1.p1  ORF type:complete len:567 (-),score=108.31 TRINITY_DN97751_c0_g1_i1:20-1486(-)